ncbi:SAM-dependent methyltransferase [Streptomyces virginiae]|uniref:SAM-dependent methyltransferase n=1 Tax=Streptomyces virginiae TaxID=1961 RepID=UPI0036845426
MRSATEPGDRYAPLDLTLASSARVHDVLLGEQQYQVDRDLAAALQRAAPWIVRAAQDNREHGLRAAEFLARAGHRQFLDLGAGIPRGSRDGDIQDVVRAVQPDARIVSVDTDAVAHSHRRAHNEDLRDRTVRHDVTDTAGLLAHPGLDTFDHGQPIAVLAHEVLSEVADTHQVVRLMAELRDRLPPGSAISLTHAALDSHRDDPVRTAATAQITRLYHEAGISFYPRTRYEVTALAGSWTLAEPGVSFVGRWHPRTKDIPAPVDAAYAFIAHSPLPGNPTSPTSSLAALRTSRKTA